MSTEAFSLVSGRLAAVLRKGIPGHPSVVLTDPSGADEGAVSLWLYQVAADEFVRNAPVPRAETGDGRTVRYRLPPLGVNLFYLLTPMAKDPAAQQNQLAQAMLALHENSVVRVPDPSDPDSASAAADAEVTEAVRVSLIPDSLDDRVRLWESINKPYRLSVAYQVRTVRLVSKLTEDSGTVGRVVAAKPGEEV
jgi:hypothetical protein